jgi:hypothetical protein
MLNSFQHPCEPIWAWRSVQGRSLEPNRANPDWRPRSIDFPVAVPALELLFAQYRVFHITKELDE